MENDIDRSNVIKQSSVALNTKTMNNHKVEKRNRSWFLSVYIVTLFLYHGAAAADVANQTSYVSARTHDLQLLVNQSQNVTFDVVYQPSSTQFTNGSITIVFDCTPDHIVKVEPAVVHLQGTEHNFTLTVTSLSAGKAAITANSSHPNVTNVQQAYIRVTVQHSKAWYIFSQVIGWVYFVAWSVSFYPQIYENWKRKSVIGLSFDFLGLNVVGFTLYSLFNVGLYWVKPIQQEYFSRHPTGLNPVQLNDVIFSLHAVFACVVTITQCFLYERGHQSVSRICKLILVAIALFLAISLILSLSSVLKYLDFLYFCSYVKLFITLIKYVPQAYLNFRRKSTMGWSIGNILLDFTGGILSIGQMFVLSYNESDWGSIFGDPTKFGLGLFSVLFDILFILQHYVFYRNNIPSEQLVNDPTDHSSNDNVQDDVTGEASSSSSSTD